LPVVAAIVSSSIQKTQKLGKPENNLRRSDSPALRQSGYPSFPSVPIFCGEVGLLGEIRMVPGWPRRQKEVNRLGLGRLVGKPEIGHIGQLRKYLQ
jgi:hypothetical protein